MIIRIDRSGVLPSESAMLFNREGKVVLRGAMLHSDNPDVKLLLVCDTGKEIYKITLSAGKLYQKGFTKRELFWPYVAVYDTVNNNYLTVYDPRVQREYYGRFYIELLGPEGASYDVAVELDYEEV